MEEASLVPSWNEVLEMQAMQSKPQLKFFPIGLVGVDIIVTVGLVRKQKLQPSVLYNRDTGVCIHKSCATEGIKWHGFAPSPSGTYLYCKN